MSADLPSVPASPNFEKLKAKLRELFELDKADLDFGIYRVLRQRHSEITEFLDKHLEKTVRAALTTHGALQQTGVEKDLEEAEKAASSLGVAPEQSAKVMELRAKLAKGADLEATADEVYSHLLTFFSRYYQVGDFLGLQRSTVHGREKYVIPYNGEEVKLVWANMDQYYIKSSELLRDYTFRIRKAEIATGELNLNDFPDESVVQFKLVEGDTEKDNRKPDGKTTRAFSLDEDKPFEEDGDTLTIRFRYREHTSERNLQDKLNADTEKTLADSLPANWKAILFTADTTFQPKDKKDTRSVLQKHLRGYTAKFSCDYFIHKDLGAFLRRELDFYVKNEVMYLDDIEDVTAPKAEEYLSKIRAIRRCAIPVIQMISQLEDFQKKLWLKKKFVVETRYCITLDRVPDALYQEICACDAQWQEWEELVALSDLKPQRTPEFLKANPYLMLDTRHFSREFTLKLLASIEDLDANLDGVCFHSENFQALQLMQERYREQVMCVYIDPPYNTGSDGFAYKDSYQHSSWATMMFDRVIASRDLMRNDAAMFTSINELEVTQLKAILAELLAPVNMVTVKTKIAGVSGSHHGKSLRNANEHLLIHAKSPSEFAFTEKVYDTQELLQFIEEMEESGSSWKYTSVLKSIDEGTFVKTIKDGSGNDIRVYRHDAVDIGSINRLARDDYAGDLKSAYYKNIKKIFRTTNAQSSIRTRVLEETADIGSDIISIVYVPKTGRNAGKETRLYYKDAERNLIAFLSDTVVEIGDSIFKKITSGTLWTDIQYNNLALEGGVSFNNGKKPLLLVRKAIEMLIENEGLTLDYFAGSGTSAHAVIALNREDDGKRKYALVEMGDYVETVLVPRIKKVVYSGDWKDGRPQKRDTGISHAFKIVRLESYEDTLNNLNLRRTPEQDAALAQADESNRDQYLLAYFLNVESACSASLLDVEQFRDPFAYKLHIATSSAGETKETTVDLVETFNWLLGLKVKHIDTAKGFLTVTGEKRAGGRCLILWRTLSDDPKADNEALEKFLTKLAVNPADTEYDFLYVNGAHTLNDPHNKVHLIEETFQRLMFDTTTFESLS